MVNRFTIEIPCKPYIKSYLENNCGDPVDLQHLPDLKKILINQLRKPLTHQNSKNIGNYNTSVQVIISEDVFYRYGWELTRQSITYFNRKAEEKLKFFMRNYISLNRSIGVPVAKCIREFQDEHCFPEPIWSTEAIKKDFDRNGHYSKLNTLMNLREEIKDILLVNLSVLGTVSHKYINEYKNESR